jgi:hypothetical protein
MMGFWKKLIEYLVAGLRGSPPPVYLTVTGSGKQVVVPGFSIIEGYSVELRSWHDIFNSQSWILIPFGVGVPNELTGRGGAVCPRTKGDPTTASRIMKQFGKSIEKWGRVYDVPRELIVACIATESRGRPKAYREESRFENQYKTPHRVSAGLMQTLVSTAQRTLDDPGIDVAWLLDPDHSIQAGTAYIANQRHLTKLDPPLVAAGYNAGGLYHEDKKKNPWKLRCYPMGTGRHITKFVEFYNDAVWLLNQNDGALIT